MTNVVGIRGEREVVAELPAERYVAELCPSGDHLIIYDLTPWIPIPEGDHNHP